ncbi:MAG: co-chaperone HscB [Pseudomonadota bacterium]|jgi:molecular chaperone HscB
MKLDSDDFELFAIPRRFAQERAALDQRWRVLQGEVHPDRFVSEGTAAQRVAMQWAVRVNEAYQRLKNPLQRAAYLCELAGVPVNAESNTSMPGAFLMQQMAWREALDDATNLDEVQALADEVGAQRGQGLADLERSIDEERDYNMAAQQVRALMFIERFVKDIDRRLEALEQ